MAFAEAMAHGLPIVATNAGAVPQTVPAEAGRLVAPGDPRALAEALRSLLGDRDELARLAAGARRAAVRLPSWEESVACWEASFDRLVR
jgi:glycosyltransferase involved in cell wall biosynthesis